MDAEQNTSVGPGDRSRQVPLCVLVFFFGLGFGAMLMAAMSKADVDKAIWFCAGLVVSGGASAWQAHSARMLASETRDFQQREAIRAHTIAARMDAYENFVSFAFQTLEDVTDKALLNITHAHTRVRIVGSKPVVDSCTALVTYLTQIWPSGESSDLNVADGRLGELVREVVKAIRDDLGTSKIEVTSPKC